MILVTLGTQDKDFSRLLKAIDKLIEKKVIKEKVIVQAGYTKYKSKNMQIFDLIDQEELENLTDKCSLLITHGGVGSILMGIKKNKKIIAAARLSKYKEHTNDHQKEIIKEFVKDGYIKELKNFNKLEEVIKETKKFKPKKFESNTNNFISLVDNYIEEDKHISWYNKYKEVLLYLLFGGLTTIVNILTFYIFRKLNVELYISNIIAWIISVLFAFITNKLFVFESKNKTKKENIKEITSFFGFRLLSLVFDMGSMFLLINILKINDLLSKIFANILVVILNYIFSKLFIFKK